MKNKWTLQDEKDWVELCSRRANFQRERLEPLQNFLRSYHAYNMADIIDCEEFMINNADEIRYLLEPFDSGVKQVKNDPT